MSVDLKVDFCSHEAAKYAVEHWHYSEVVPVGKTVKFGAWEDGQFVGSVIFSPGANKNIGGPYGLKQVEVCELVRVALSNHKSHTSQIVTESIRQLRRQSGGLRLLVSYADPEQGHVGSIYQAMNWIFVGGSGNSRQYFYRGKWTHSKTFSAEWSNLYHVDVNKLQTRLAPSKYKYLYPLDKAMRRQIEPLRKPYPKRADVGEIESR